MSGKRSEKYYEKGLRYVAKKGSRGNYFLRPSLDYLVAREVGDEMGGMMER